MLLTFIIILVALVFDFLNGFHDAANSIATVVSTRVLTPRLAVLWAAFFNFIAAFAGAIGIFLTGWMGLAALDHFFNGLGNRVAHSIASGVVDAGIVDSRLILAALVGAIFWNLATWYYGLPASSSHALIGGLIGAAIAKAGPASLIWTVPGKLKGIAWVCTFIFISPLVGLAIGFLLMLAIMWIFHRAAPGPMDRMFRRGQLLSAAFFSLSHGLNDAQKTMGIIVMTLLAASTAGTIPADSFFHMTPAAAKSPVSLWIVLVCHTAIGLGTYFGGWRIVKTMGMKITRLQPVGGFAAETAAGIAIIMASSFGIPVSTTHTITGGIMGAGSSRRLSAVRWGVAGTIVWAWILTIPASALVAWLAYWMLFPLGA